jgi:hypothetical protein
MKRGGVLAAVFGCVFLLGLSPIADGDIFWHLAAAREMLRAHAFLRFDPFTISAAGRPWPDVHWLFQLGAYAIHQVAGLTGLVVTKALLVAAGAVILTRAAADSAGRAATGGAARGDDQSVADTTLVLCAIGLSGALFLARHALLPRPILVTLLMLAIFFAVLENCRADSASATGSTRRLFLLPLAEVVWANCQGLAALGPALIAAYAIAALLSPRMSRGGWSFESERHLPRRALLVTLGLCVAALFATPYGLRGAALPTRLFLRLAPTEGNVFSAQVAENVPPLVLYQTAPGLVAQFPWYLAALGLCLMIARRRLRLSHGLVLLGFGLLAMMANRNVLLFYWLATPIAAMMTAPAVRRFWARGASKVSATRATIIARIAVVLALAGQIALAVAALAGESSLAEPVPFHFPVRSARYLGETGARGSIFAPDHHGGYLSFVLPDITPYIDTRLTLHTATEYAAYLDAVDHPLKFDVLDDAIHFKYVVLTTSYPDRYLALAQHLAASRTWRLVYTDGSELLFAHGGVSVPLGERATTQAILRDLAARFSAPRLHEAARLHLARLLVVLERTDEAEYVLSTLDSGAALQLRARSHFAAGELAAAEALALTGVDTNAHDVRSLALLAQIAFASGHPDPGVTWLRRALDVDPTDPESRALLNRIEGVSATPGR